MINFKNPTCSPNLSVSPLLRNPGLSSSVLQISGRARELRSPGLSSSLLHINGRAGERGSLLQINLRAGGGSEGVATPVHRNSRSQDKRMELKAAVSLGKLHPVVGVFN